MSGSIDKQGQREAATCQTLSRSKHYQFIYDANFLVAPRGNEFHENLQ